MIRRLHSPGAGGVLNAAMATAGVAFLLGVWGVLTIASSQSAAPTALLIGKQFGALVAGMVVMLAAARIPFEFYRRQVWVLALLFFLPLLILPLAGVRVNGMCGWFRVGAFSLQPTEPAKGIFLLSLVVTMSSLRSESLRFWGALAVASLWLTPIFLQPDFGTSAIYLAGFAAVYFLAGGRIRNLLIFFTGAAAAAALFVWSHPYAWRRITGLFQPELDPSPIISTVSRIPWAAAGISGSLNWPLRAGGFSGRSSGTPSGATPICRSPTTIRHLRRWRRRWDSSVRCRFFSDSPC